MKESLILNQVIVKKSPIHGYGVFAQKDMVVGEILEECYGLDFFCDNACLSDYTFAASEPPPVTRMLTGFGSLYNHSDTPNAGYAADQQERIVTFTAMRPIRAGEEIFTSYGKAWFSFRNISIKRPPFWRRWRNPVTSILLKTGILCGAYLAAMHLLHALLAVSVGTTKYEAKLPNRYQTEQTKADQRPSRQANM